MERNKRTRTFSGINSILMIFTLLLRITQIQSSTPLKARTPCRTFVWDGPSAWRYHLCKRLLRGRVYEGLGGRKFVRIKPYSVLSSLYPLSNHGPDRCLICGHSFENHLATWWFPHLYSSFDQHLDRMYQRYTVSDDDSDEWGHSSKKKKKKKKPSRNAKNTHMQQTYGMPFSQYSEPGLQPMHIPGHANTPFRKREFHTAYVEDITKEQTKNVKGRGNTSKLIKRGNGNRSGYNDKEHSVNSVRDFLRSRQETRKIAGMKYRVPAIDVSGDDMNLSSALTLAFVRTMVLERLDSFITLQDRDNRWHEWKMMHGM